MIIISHRGNLKGINKKTENSPNQILKAISFGFDVEIDCWYIDNQLFLGHDYGAYEIDLLFLEKIKERAWIHCKNLKALLFFQKTDFNYFWHQSDKYALTSKKYIWTYPNVEYAPNSFIVDLDLSFVDKERLPTGICTDFPKMALTLLA